MSYYTHFEGEFHLNQPLTAMQVNTLKQFAKERHEEPGAPNVWCQWVPTEDGSGIAYTDEEMSSYNWDDWLRYIIAHFLQPWGLRLSGEMRYQGEDPDDRGVLYVRDNEVEVVEDVISNPGPTWQNV